MTTLMRDQASRLGMGVRGCMQLAFFASEGDFYVSAGSVLITDRGAEALMRQDRNTSKNAISRGN